MARSLISLLVAALPEAQRNRALRKKRLRPIRPSHAAELNYLSGLADVVEDCRAAGDTIAAGLRPTFAVFDDAAGERQPLRAGDPLLRREFRAADETAPGADRLIEQASAQLENMVSARADLLSRLAARRALAGVDDALVKNIQRAVGVDITSYLSPTTEIGQAMKAAVADNVALIKSIPEKYLEKVAKAVDKSFAAGERWETLAEKIEKIGDVTYNRARLIARDQTSKMNAAFSEVRQTSVGITHYTWSTSHDERVRKSHADLNGKDFAWKDPPEVEGEKAHPGQPVNCRCAAIPLIKFDDIAGGGTEERVAA